LGNNWGWGSPGTVATLVVGVACGAAFAARERRAGAPLLDPRLLRRVPFAVGAASGFCSYLVLFGTMLAVPFFLERARALGPDTAGLVLASLPVAIGLTAPLVGRLAERYGTELLVPIGLVIAAGGVAGLATRPRDYWMLAAWLLLVGVGLGTCTPANNVGALLAAPRQQAGVASGVLNMTRGIGTAFGLALTTLLLTSASSPDASPATADRAFAITAICLAGVAMLAALLNVVTSTGARPDKAAPPGDG
jgi:MFS family permease